MMDIFVIEKEILIGKKKSKYYYNGEESSLIWIKTPELSIFFMTEIGAKEFAIKNRIKPNFLIVKKQVNDNKKEGSEESGHKLKIGLSSYEQKASSYKEGDNKKASKKGSKKEEFAASGKTSARTAKK